MPGRVTNLTNIVSLLGAFLATSVVLGLLAAGLVMPAVGATGATARAGVHVFDTLPGDFTLTPLSQQSRILASDGTLIATPYDENAGRHQALAKRFIAGHPDIPMVEVPAASQDIHDLVGLRAVGEALAGQ